MKITLAELKEKKSFLNSIDITPNDRLTYAVRKLWRTIQKAEAPLMEDLQETIEENLVRHAMVGEKGELLLNGAGKYQYTPENMVALNKAQKKAIKAVDAKSVNVTPFIMGPSELPERAKSLDPMIKEELKGLLF